MTTIANVFSSVQLDLLNNLPEVTAAKAKLATSNVVYFTTPLTDAIKTVLQGKFALDLKTSEIPMRWIKGDTPAHTDSGASEFKNTYLVYLNDSQGEFILDTTSYSITANTGFVFSEGLTHKTENTGTQPRLLLGPMNEFGESVGAVVLYYSNYADAFAGINSIALQGGWIINDPSAYVTDPIYNSYRAWRVAYAFDIAIPTGVYRSGFDLSVFGNTEYRLYPVAPCFLEGTNILCQIDGQESYLPIESLKRGTLVKTSRDGFKKIEVIGKGPFKNPGHSERIEQRLYKCSRSNYPELKKDLYITGCHSILIKTLTDEQRELSLKTYKDIFVTDKMYRLTAYMDDRAEPWTSEGDYTIWHLALENEDPKMNYGIYANGLLVESCAINFLKNRTNMEIV